MTELAAAPVIAGPSGRDEVPLIETRNLTKHFKVGGNLSRRRLHAVDNVNLVIHRKEIVALVGESGSGKSTIARLLAQVYRPSGGEIRYQGRPLSARRSRRDILAYRSDVQLAQPGVPRVARHHARPQAAPPGAQPGTAAGRGRAGGHRGGPDPGRGHPRPVPA